ncbi:MAG: hypothetical protein Q8L27_02850 [archaeon]|nr:hypothetical protein [archaeon]
MDYVLESRTRRYRRKFLNELQTYCLEPRKERMPPGNGCVCELEDLEKINLDNPQQLAKLIKEGIHLMYQKQTARRVLYSLLENL